MLFIKYASLLSSKYWRVFAHYEYKNTKGYE